MTKIKTKGIITKKDVLKYAAEQGYDINLFLEYLKFQQKEVNKNDGEFKMPVEECALATPELDMNSFENLDWYSNWMGFGDRDYIPSEYDFKTFCTRRDNWMYKSHSYDILQKINSDNEIYVFRDDNLQSLKISEANDFYKINLRSNDKLDLKDFNQGKVLAMALVTEKDDALCAILEKFYNNLKGNPITCDISSRIKGNIEVISGIKGFSMVADINYLSQPPISISMDINKEDNEDAFFATKELYSDLDNIKTKSENINTRLSLLRIKAK